MSRKFLLMLLLIGFITSSLAAMQSQKSRRTRRRRAQAALLQRQGIRPSYQSPTGYQPLTQTQSMTQEIAPAGMTPVIQSPTEQFEQRMKAVEQRSVALEQKAIALEQQITGQNVINNSAIQALRDQINRLEATIPAVYRSLALIARGRTLQGLEAMKALFDQWRDTYHKRISEKEASKQQSSMQSTTASVSPSTSTVSSPTEPSTTSSTTTPNPTL